jgi:hypothetical protein
MSAQSNAVPIEQITPNVLQLARLAARSRDTDKVKHDRALAQLKQLVENPNAQDGAYWHWSWTAFCRGSPERGILPIKEVLKQHQSSSSDQEQLPAQRRPAEEPAVDQPLVAVEVGVQTKAEERDYSKESIELLTTRARALLRKEKDARLSAGYILIELKKRITDKSTIEGQPWNWSWRTYVAGDPDSGIPAMLERTVRDADRLISYVKSDDPAATIAADRQATAERVAMRRRRSETYVRPTLSAQEQAEAAVAELHELSSGGRIPDALIEIAAEPRSEVAAQADGEVSELIEIGAEARTEVAAQANGEVSEEQAAWDRLERAWNAASWGTRAKFAAWAMNAMAQAA